MPAITPPDNGRLNLDQQRKRAKELLRSLRHGKVDDRLHNRAPARLADAQYLIARDLGFASWPRLKAHCDTLAFAVEHPDFIASDTPDTCHWRCGNDIQHSLQLAGFKGQLQMYADPLCMGPVPELDEPSYRAIRASFISHAFGLELGQARQRLDQECAALARLAQQAPSVLWCEADAYDQLFLLRVLAGLEQVPDNLSLIEIAQVPGVQRFIGIGQLAPELLAWLWPQRRPVNAAMLSLARQAWAAYRAPAPQAWAALAHTQHHELPLLAPALLRQLQELPSVRDGLALTERLTLQILGEMGPMPMGKAFAELMQVREPLPYLGDMMFHAVLRPLIDAPRPLIDASHSEREGSQRIIRLTADGERVLAGQAYGLELIGCERWVGGVRLQPGLGHWALDESLQPVWRD